jgi:hypothetical protein
MEKAHKVALACAALIWPGVSSAQINLGNLNGARFVEQYRSEGQVVAEFIFEIRGTEGRWRSRSVGGPWTRMSCTMQGWTCDLCCGEPGTLGAEPGARTTVEVLADGRNAIWRFRPAGGRQGQDITLVRVR